MIQEHAMAFGPFRLETPPGRLWHGDHLIPLRPRSLAMLRYLTAHPGRLVTKAEVQQHVWGGTPVTPSVLRVCVREIRAALGDAAGAPRYLATVGRQGVWSKNSNVLFSQCLRANHSQLLALQSTVL